MKIQSVYDPSFKSYGQVLTGYDTAALTAAMERIPLPEAGVAYEPSIAALEATAIFGQLQNNAYGGMPVQIGMCWGRNTRLNCLEYHRDSEVNIGSGEFTPAGEAGRDHGWQAGHHLHQGIPSPRRGGCGGLCNHPALRPLPCGCSKGLPGGRGAAEGDQRGQTRHYHHHWRG